MSIRDSAKRIRIANILRSLVNLTKVSFLSTDDNRTIWIRNENVFVPDFVFKWSDGYKHYRVYIYVASTEWDKTKSGYTICVISNSLVATGFVMLYQFLHRHRANNKEASMLVT